MRPFSSLPGELALILACFSLPTLGEVSFTKFAQEDSFVASCQYRESRFGDLEYLEVRGFEPSDGRTEGSLYPFDDSAAGWCGSSEAGESSGGGLGQRTSYITFDMRDFSSDTISTATLRMKPAAFPPETTVLVRGGCATGWGEAQLTWSAAAAGAGLCADCEDLCTWSGADFAPHELADAVYTCDVTAAAQAAGGARLCLSLYAEPSAANARAAAVFHSRNANERALRPHDPVHRSAQSAAAAGSYNQGTVAGALDSWRPHLRLTSSTQNVVPV